jgi:cellulose synthase/poly-beta-1,6-N-acetylglucosamine synthase-like glycosyltransferase
VYGLLAHLGEGWSDVLQAVAWVVAGAWVVKASDALRFMPTVTRLDSLDWDVGPVEAMSLTVVVPAKDEAENIAATLDALLAADYRPLRILAVDDRSEDATGTIMEEYAKKQEIGRSVRLDVMHITELPEGWLGKTHALMAATERIVSEGGSEFILYTDADVLFSPSILRRAMAFAEATEADHLVVLPTMQVKSWGEGIVLGFFQIFGLWASRPWKVEDADSRRDIVGVGAFNLVRRAALEEIGGWSPQRLAILEDITLGRRMKAARMRQRIAFAPGLVLVHWAAGARGLVRVMTKNLFSAFNFRTWMLLGAGAWIVVFCLGPVAGLLTQWTLLPSLVVFCCIAAAYRVMGEASWIDARYGWAYPLGACAFLWAMLRSAATVLWQRGVVWRGTFYELKELRQHNSPFVWQREAQRLREEQLQAKKMVARAKRKAEKSAAKQKP